MYAKRGMIDEALDDIAKVVELVPDDVNVYATRGYLKGQKGDYNGAIEDFTKVLKLNPKFVSVYPNRAIAYYYIKDYNNSWKDVHEAEKNGYKIKMDFLSALKRDSKRAK
jgi:tetratricopeptide (TPR) repeat protein